MDSCQRPGSGICTDISPQSLYWNATVAATITATVTSTVTATNTTTNNVKHLPRNQDSFERPSRSKPVLSFKPYWWCRFWSNNQAGKSSTNANKQCRGKSRLGEDCIAENWVDFYGIWRLSYWKCWTGISLSLVS